jgi:hypothetical protein
VKSVPRRESIFDVARVTWSDRENITLDEVDGAFYWGVCREDLTSAWQQQKKLVDADDLAGPDDRRHLFNLLHDIEMESPGAPQWSDFPRFGMRSPITLNTGSILADIEIPTFDVGVRRKIGGASGWVLVGVRNSLWTGDEVEHQVLKVAQGRPDWLDQWIDRGGQEPGFGALSMVSFHFYDSNTLEYQSLLTSGSRPVTPETPVIVCSVRLPLPPKGTIAAIYDATVIGKHKWNTRLHGYGTGHNQTVDVAIRTWMIGLLMGTGVKFTEAQREAESLFLASITQTGFIQNRSFLVDRVPEAEPFLFQRKRRRT